MGHMETKYTLKELCRYPLGTFAEIIQRNSLLYPNNEAFIYRSKRVTFAEFNERVNRLIHGLKGIGCKKGDVIGVLSWNCLEYMDAWGAAMKGGFILAHLNPRLSETELSQVLLQSGSKVLLCGADFSDMAGRFQHDLEELRHYFVFDTTSKKYAYDDFLSESSPKEPEVDMTAEDPLTIFYTSGTTGAPKGAVYNHRQKLENTMVKALEMGIQTTDRSLIVLPMFHIGGDSHIWPFFMKGACNIIQERGSFDPAVMLKTIQDEKVTDVQIVATQLIVLLNNPGIDRYNLGSLKRIWYAASPMPTEVLKRGLAKFGPIFMQGYGMTESGPNTTRMTKEAHIQSKAAPEEYNVLASCGQPCIGVQVRIVDDEGEDLPPGEVGEIIVRSSLLMTEYWQQPKETENVIKNGWLHTGDMGYYDNNAYIYVVDRKKDMIITGGENVYSKEVEDVLYQHPAVYEAAVIGIEDSHWIECVHAVIVKNNGAQVTDEEIIAFCKERIAKYKAPKSIEFVKELPKSPQGKILKRELKKIVSEKA